MNLRKLLVAALTLLGLAEGAWAVPAYPGKIRVRQADGTTLILCIHGDEHTNYTTTDDGFPILLNPTSGNYEYATLRQGTPCASGITAADASLRSDRDRRFLSTVDKTTMASALRKRRLGLSALNEKADLRKTRRNPRRTLVNNFPHTGEQRSLVILMEFNDKRFTSMAHPQQYYADAMNQPGFTAANGANGSVRDFFLASSAGRFRPTFDVYGPVRINYGQHDAGQGTYDTEVNMGTFVKAAIEGLDDQIDFSQYDHDGDGYVDNVYIYYAGVGSADSRDAETIWPHAYDMQGWGIDVTTNDGVKIGSYTCSNEVDGYRSGNLTAGIGTFVHEFGHCLGLADHYDTSNSWAKYTPDCWDTMASGSYNNDGNTPPLYSSFERCELGWLEPEDLTAEADTVNRLPNLGDSNKAYLIRVPGVDSEYFLLENRQQKGWDAYLPASGLLVWHIDDDPEVWAKSEVNNTPAHQHVDIVEANGKQSGNTFYYKGVPFPGANHVTSHAFVSWDGDPLLDIDSIAVADSVVTFCVAGVETGIVQPFGSMTEGHRDGTADNRVYDLMGRQVNSRSAKGILIRKVNGKMMKVAQ